MWTLEEILQEYFNCSKPFRKDGSFTYRGAKAFNKLVGLVYALGTITDLNAEKIVRTLDEISNINK